MRHTTNHLRDSIHCHRFPRLQKLKKSGRFEMKTGRPHQDDLRHSVGIRHSAIRYSLQVLSPAVRPHVCSRELTCGGNTQARTPVCEDLSPMLCSMNLVCTMHIAVFTGAMPRDPQPHTFVDTGVRRGPPELFLYFPSLCTSPRTHKPSISTASSFKAFERIPRSDQGPASAD